MIETFAQKKHKTDNPFHKLYYEILSRFHAWDYEKALDSMSADLRVIIENCTQEMIREGRLSEEHLRK